MRFTVRVWRRAKAGVAAETTELLDPFFTRLHDHVAELDVGTRADIGDVHREIGEVMGGVRQMVALLHESSRTLAVLKSELAQLREDLQETRSAVGEVHGLMDHQLDIDGQSTELLGRLLKSATDRLKAVEAAVAEKDGPAVFAPRTGSRSAG